MYEMKFSNPVFITSIIDSLFGFKFGFGFGFCSYFIFEKVIIPCDSFEIVKDFFHTNLNSDKYLYLEGIIIWCKFLGNCVILDENPFPNLIDSIVFRIRYLLFLNIRDF